MIKKWVRDIIFDKFFLTQLDCNHNDDDATRSCKTITTTCTHSIAMFFFNIKRPIPLVCSSDECLKPTSSLSPPNDSPLYLAVQPFVTHVIEDESHFFVRSTSFLKQHQLSSGSSTHSVPYCSKAGKIAQ